MIYLVPHSHYDAAWVFTKEDYLYINIESIIKKAVEIMDKSDFRFIIEQTALLEEIERRTPQLFAQIARLVQEGKIEIAGGEYLMSDAMIPNGETLVRQILSGKKYIRDKFGIDVPVMWGADSFGYNAQLPQIYKKAGYQYFAFRRGASRNKPSEFWWQGLDGTRILSHWMPLGYRAGLDLARWGESLPVLKQAAATGDILMPAGSGSIPPQAETVGAVKKWNRAHPHFKIKIAKPSDFFAALEKKAGNLTVRSGEMYSGRYSKVFPYCSSSRIWVKQDLRKYENLLLACEKWATIVWLLGLPYPIDEFRDNWKKVLWGAFHDVASGTGVDESYKEARDNFAFLQTHLAQVFYTLLTTISQSLETWEDIIVFNPLSWEVRNWVEVELGFERGKIKKIAGLKSGQEEIGVEVLDFTRYADDSYQTAKIGFVATVPALGYHTYRILERKPRGQTAARIKIKGNTIRNRFFEVRVNPANGLIDIFQGGRWLAGGNELVLDEETGDLYYHRQNLDKPLSTEGGDGVNYGRFRMRSFKIDKTPLRRVINIEADYYSLIWPYRLQDKLRPILWRHTYLSVSKKIIIYDDIPRIDFITTINNRHPQVQIRVKFATGISSKKYQSEIQFGVLSRPVDQCYVKPRGKWEENPCGVYPALNWIDYSDKERGVTLANQGLPSHEIRDGNIYLTLLRSILMLSADGITGPAVPTPDAQEFKTCSFQYALCPHGKGWPEADCFKPAYEFNHGLAGFQLPVARGKRKLPSYFSFVEITPCSLILAAFKKADNADAVILRLFETKGQRTRGVIRLFKEPASVQRVNLLEEEEEGRVGHQGNEISLSVKPFEIVSLKIRF